MSTTTHAAEQAVIASCLSNQNAYPACHFLKPDDFQDHRHATAWRIMQGLAKRRAPINQLTVWIESHRSHGAGLSYQYLTRLVDELPTAVGCEWYARQVQEAAENRRVIAAGHAIAAAGEQPGRNLKAKAQALLGSPQHWGSVDE